MRITINSRKLKRRIVFQANDGQPSAYVRCDHGRAELRQMFDARGNALTASTEAELRRIARRYIATHSEG